ncbi:thioredoxin-disulfide reductase [Chloroflexota bacterium]
MTSDSKKEYDVVIIGGGPAGLSAGIYTARDRLGSLLIEKGMVGGQIVNTEQMENYPGFADSISGMELTQLIYRQATKFGLETIFAEVTGIEINGKRRVIKTTEGDFIAKAVIIASGSERTKLGIPGEDEFIGRGVSVCATCDAAFFENQSVAVVGGGNAAISEALHLSKFASKVTVIHRRNQLRATRIMQEKAFAAPKIEFLLDTVVEEIVGGDFVKSLKLCQVSTGQKSTLDVAGIFLAVGLKPNTNFLKGVLPLDANDAIIADGNMETDITGIFAAGDVRHNSIRQVVAATGDGAIAAVNAEKFIAKTTSSH